MVTWAELLPSKFMQLNSLRPACNLQYYFGEGREIDWRAGAYSGFSGGLPLLISMSGTGGEGNDEVFL